MNRTAWLAALAWILATGPAPAVAFGGFGGQPEEGPIERTVRIEMEGGHKLEGKVYFQPLIVESELGRYTIRPDKIRTIQFLRRADVGDAGAADQPQNPQPNGMMRGVMGRGMGMGPGMGPRPDVRVRGKVVTTSDRVIIGDIRLPAEFSIELEFGRLTPAPDKLRVLTMVDGELPSAGSAPSRPSAPPAGRPKS